MIVDDEKLMQRLVYDTLSSLGFRQITVATSGRHAIHNLNKQTFDFIITDWRMQDLEGIDIIRHVRSSTDPVMQRTPIILLTGNTEAHYVHTAHAAGVNEYLLKPFTADQLTKRIRNIIERPRGFVEAPVYKGPDRRRREGEPPNGTDRRSRKN
jgi:DNA-binding response OmpR family regulator